MLSKKNTTSAKNTNTKSFIKDILETRNEIKITNKLSATLRLIFYFSLYLIAVILYKDVLSFFKSNPTLFKYLLFSGISYNPLILITYVLKFTLIKIKITNKTMKNLKDFSFSVIKFILNFLLTNSEMILTPIYIMLASIYISNSEIRNEILGGETSVYFKYFIQSLVISGVILSIIIDIYKTSFLRGLSFRNRGLFWKVEGIFEQFLFLGFSLVTIVHGMKVDSEGTKEDTLRLVGVIFELAVLTLINVLYFRELPYFDLYIEKLVAYLIIAVTSVHLCYEFYRDDIESTLKVCSFFTPFCLFLTRVYLKKKMSVDYLDNKRLKIGHMAKFMLRGTEIRYDDEEFLYNQGVFRNFLLNKKNLSEKYYKLWKKMMKRNKVSGITSSSSLKSDLEAETEALMENNLNNEGETTNFKENEKKRENELINELHQLVLRDYVKVQNYNSYSCLIFILWMLENNLIMSEIFRCLNHMITKSSSFKNRYYYYYAKKEIENKLKDYYFKSNILLKATKKIEDQVNVSNKSEFKLKFMNKIGVDLDYCFFYKQKVKLICDMIEEFTDLNNKYILNLKSQSRSVKELDILVAKQYKIDDKITQEFTDFHSITRKVDTIHLSPYFYYLFKCVNLHRSASKIFKVYRERMINKKNLIDPNSEEIEDINLMTKSILFKVESEKKNFGNIIDIFGDVRYLRVEYKDLLTQNMNVLIPEFIRGAHDLSCSNFTHKKIQGFLGDSVSTFLTIPSQSDLILPVSMKIKIIPYEITNFKYVAGFRYLNSDTNMYILLDEQNIVKNFSYNMKFLFENSKNYLKTETKVSELCPEIFRDITGNKNFNERSGTIKTEFNGKNMESGNKEDSVMGFMAKDIKNVEKEIIELDDNSQKKNFEFTHQNNKKSKTYTFKFKNNSTGIYVEKCFKTKIIKKKFRYSNFGYNLLVLSNEEDQIGNLFDNENYNIQDILNSNNFDQNEDTESECPELKTEVNETHNIRSFNGNGLNLMSKISQRDSTRQPLIGTSHRENSAVRQNNNTESRVYLNRDDIKISVSNIDINTPIFEEEPQEKINENQRKISKDEDKYNYENMKEYLGIEKDDKYTLSANSSFNMENSNNSEYNSYQQPKDKFYANESMQSQGHNNPNNNKLVLNDEEYLTEEEDEEDDEIERFTEKMIKQKVLEGTGSVFTNSNLQAYKKYYAFEDAVNRTGLLCEFLTLVFLYLISLSTTVYFTVTIKNTLVNTNHVAEIQSDIVTTISEHSFEVQNLYSNFLSRVAYNEKMIEKDRFSRFNFKDKISGIEGKTTDYSAITYDFSNIESYLEYSYNQTKSELLRLMQDVYTQISSFGDRNTIFFSNKVEYFLRRVGGEKKLLENSFYQGYLLFGTAKILQIEKLPISSYTKKTAKSELHFIMDNFMNGLLVGETKFNDFIFGSINSIYEDVVNILVRNLIIVVCFVTLLLLATFVLVVRVKNSFSEIYHSYGNITEGEFDERLKMLSDMQTMITEFKVSGYYADFMGTNEGGFMKKNQKKKGGKFLNNFYCFRVLASMSFLVIFYVLQMVFASSMMLTWKNNVDTAIWMNQKHKTLRGVIQEQSMFFNSLKQLMVLGEEFQVNNTDIKIFLPNLKEKMKKDSGKIFEIFEESSENLRKNLSNFLKEKSNASLCTYVNKLKERQELCQLLDNKIPSKGIVQSYFRVTQYLKELHSLIETGDKLEVLNHEEFIELEYTWENVYLESFIQLEIEIHRFFEEFIKNNIESTVVLLVRIMVVFVLVRFCFSSVSIVVIFKRIKEVCFSYQLLSIDTVIDNTGVRLNFLKLFRLDQKHF